MKIDCISDLHGYLPTLEGGDLLIIAGDLTAHDNQYEYFKFHEWAAEQEYKKVVVIAGNHDMWIEENDSLEKASCFKNGVKVEYLQDSGTEFEGLTIWGCPWTDMFPGINPYCTAFTEPFGCDTEEFLDEHFSLIPHDTDILITHGPPYGILDENVKGDHCGSLALLKTSLEIKCKLHVFGHIHEQGGKKYVFKREGYGDENNTIYVNASYVNERYQPVNRVVTVNL